MNPAMTAIQVNRKFRAEACYWVGVLMIAAGALTAYGIGIAIGAFVPLPFALALASWGCWFTALGFILA